MKPTQHTFLVTGGGSGIGRALAEGLHQRGHQIIIAGRRPEALAQVTQANPGMGSLLLDLEAPDSIAPFVQRLLAQYPRLDGVIHNAGIMRAEDVLAGSGYLDDAEAHVTTNLLGPIRLTAALLPHLLRQPHAVIMGVTSGLATLPLASFPTYCATKAALHSYLQSLRFQLRASSVEVIELVPPYVQTELTGTTQASDPRAMPLPEYIDETLRLLTATPTPTEVLVERVKPLRFAAKGDYSATFQAFNQAMAAHGASR